MNMARWAMMAALGILCSALAQADSTPGHYDLILTNWDSGQSFSFMPFSDPNPNAEDAFGGFGLNTDEFQNNLCPGEAFCTDPGFKFNGAANSLPENGAFSFSLGAVDENDNNAVLVNDVTVPNGGFENTGAPINEVLIFLTSNGGQINGDQSSDEFSCSSDIFQHCGFVDDGLVVEFDTPIGGAPIPSVVPEPSQTIILLIALSAVIVVRARKRSASSIFAQNLQ